LLQINFLTEHCFIRVLMAIVICTILKIKMEVLSTYLLNIYLVITSRGP